MITFTLELGEVGYWPKYQGQTNVICRAQLKLNATEGLITRSDTRLIELLKDGDEVPTGEDFVAFEDLKNSRETVLNWAKSKIEAQQVADPDAEYLVPPDGVEVETVDALTAWKASMTQVVRQNTSVAQRNVKQEIF